jgi:hypothetical protein
MKTLIIKEELVRLTGNYESAMILDYFIERYKKTKEEWMEKKSTELFKELMITVVEATMHKKINDIIKLGYLERIRSNPDGNWNRTYIYKVNMDKINKDLKNKEY